MIALAINIELHRLCDAGCLVNVTSVSPKVWVIDQSPKIALKGAMIGDVEPGKGGEKAYIRFRKRWSGKISCSRHLVLNLVEGSENLSYCFIICALCPGESGAVNAVVQSRVD
jgi:hypothetical protein